MGVIMTSMLITCTLIRDLNLVPAWAVILHPTYYINKRSSDNEQTNIVKYR